jgi:hypothetical protein
MTYIDVGPSEVRKAHPYSLFMIVDDKQGRTTQFISEEPATQELSK